LNVLDEILQGTDADVSYCQKEVVDERVAGEWLQKIHNLGEYKRARECVAAILRGKGLNKKGLAIAWTLLGSLFELDATSRNKTSIPLDDEIEADTTLHDLANACFSDARNHLGIVLYHLHFIDSNKSFYQEVLSRSL